MKNEKTELILGRGKVIISSGTTFLTGKMEFREADEIYKIGEVPNEPFKPPSVCLIFENKESLRVLLDQGQRLYQRMELGESYIWAC